MSPELLNGYARELAAAAFVSGLILGAAAVLATLTVRDWIAAYRRRNEIIINRGTPTGI